MSIETLLGFEQHTIEYVSVRLKAVQDREEGPHTEPSAAGGNLLYTMEQWCALDKEEGSGSSGSKERRRRPCGSKKEKGPQGQVGADGGAAGERKATWDDTCNNYGRTSH